MSYILSVIFHSILGFQHLTICNLTKKNIYGSKYTLRSKSNVTPVHAMKVYREWRYSCTHFYLWHLMEVHGHFHNQAAILPQKEPLVPLKRGLRVDPRASLKALEKRKISRPC
jgi:hypothetical protein